MIAAMVAVWLAFGIAGGVVGARIASWTRRGDTATKEDAPPADASDNEHQIHTHTGARLEVRIDKNGTVLFVVSGPTFATFRVHLSAMQSVKVAEMMAAAASSCFGAANDTRRVGLAYGRFDAKNGGVVANTADISFQLLPPELVDTETKPMPTPLAADPKTLN